MTDRDSPIDVVLLDMDGVLTDFVGRMCEKHEVTSPYYRGDPYNMNLGRFAMHKALHMDESEFWEPANNAEFWSGMNWMDDGKEILSIIERFFGKERIYIATSPNDCPDSASGKMQWIQREMPDYSRRVMMGSHKHLMANAKTMLIDDYDSNTHKFSSRGGATILVPRLWNKDFNRASKAAEHVFWEIVREFQEYAVEATG